MNDTAKLGLALPALLNPATVAVVGLGFGLLWLLRDDDDEATVEPVMIKLLPQPVPAAVKPVATVELDTDESQGVANQAAPAPISEAEQKEIIRNAMSELGKRSAAARAKKKAEQQEQASQA